MGSLFSTPKNPYCHCRCFLIAPDDNNGGVIGKEQLSETFTIIVDVLWALPRASVEISNHVVVAF
ncbi:hypothetical protein RchiOBHm_Chr5g0072001 [Rosa chinensis]|uniref:Uncharacterized protein n=1 Tax=Rosa chinensis TaxID=74649 RepID=A0A2P6QKJ5_ROSCH|nr:hypothetical protein RchiOBHm_Chr5g0072001 [Rosa chinensis]